MDRAAFHSPVDLECCVLVKGKVRLVQTEVASSSASHGRFGARAIASGVSKFTRLPKRQKSAWEEPSGRASSEDEDLPVFRRIRSWNILAGWSSASNGTSRRSESSVSERDFEGDPTTNRRKESEIFGWPRFRHRSRSNLPMVSKRCSSRASVGEEEAVSSAPCSKRLSPAAIEPASLCPQLLAVAHPPITDPLTVLA